MPAQRPRHTHGQGRHVDACSSPSRRCWPSTTSSRSSSPIPALHADAARAKKVNRRYAELSRIVAAHTAWQQAQRRPRRPRASSPRRTTPSPRRCPALEESLATGAGEAAPAADPARPGRRPRRDHGDQGRRGRRGERAVRRPTCCACTCTTRSRKGWKTEILDRTESDLGGYKDVQVAIKSNATDPSQGVWAHLKYEGGVHRVQRVPVDRVAGPHPHLDDRRARLPRGRRARRGRHQPERPQDRRVPLVRPRRPVGEHDRLRRAHHPPADRHRGVDAEREVAAAEPRGGDARAARPPARPPAGGARRPRHPMPARRRSARWTARSASAPTTSPRTGSPTTAPATRRTTSTR